MEDYFIIEECSKIQLEVEVMRLVREGWALYGSPFVLHEGPRMEGCYAGNTYYCQAVIKPSKEEHVAL